MSPNLSSGHFAANRLLYEQVVYNLLHLVGTVGRVDHVSKATINEQEMLVGPRDLSVEPIQCLKLCESGYVLLVTDVYIFLWPYRYQCTFH